MTGFDDLPHEDQLKCLAELATTALASYGIESAAAPQLINLSENATYRVDDAASRRRWAMRVHREGYHSTTAIASELAWLRALRTDDVVVTPVPVAGRDGELIQAVGHPAMARPRNVVLFEWENGEEPSETDHLFDRFRMLGEVTARMHDHAQGWPRSADFERLTWDFETSLGASPHWGSWRDGMGLDADKIALFAETVALIGRRLERFGKSADRFGLIHCDMRLANLLIDDDIVKVLDFDDCGFSWHLYDAATTVSFFEHEPHVPELMARWVAGYRGVRDLPAEDEAEIPTFVMLRRMLLVAWIGSHSETDLARSMGVSYTASTVPLCQDYLRKYG
ncbi:MAG: phosphotransferase [Hyphomicrobiales bacterium]|nr:phosphotransferase [Hyphomicrobiales bacterium]